MFKWTNVSEVHTSSIFKAMMEAVCTFQTSVHFNVTTQRYIQKTLNFILAAVGT
jgi:hypothetical protein